ncbi:hypothetical protein QT786_07780, partial [Xanthomonas citri pv. citri]
MRWPSAVRRALRAATANPPGSALRRADTALRALPKAAKPGQAHALSRRATGRFALTSTYMT